MVWTQREPAFRHGQMKKPQNKIISIFCQCWRLFRWPFRLRTLSSYRLFDSAQGNLHIQINIVSLPCIKSLSTSQQNWNFCFCTKMMKRSTKNRIMKHFRRNLHTRVGIWLLQVKATVRNASAEIYRCAHEATSPEQNQFKFQFTSFFRSFFGSPKWRSFFENILFFFCSNRAESRRFLFLI